MNQIDKNFKDIKSVNNFVSGYFDYLNQVLNSIDKKEIEKLFDAFMKARGSNNTIFVAGNGGSAATAMTMANDIGFDIIKKTETKKPFKVFSLVDNASVVTAISNDVGYESIFLNQLRIHYQEGDIIVLISASGNSKNIIEAARWVKSRNGCVVGFLGFDGGKLSQICDIKIHAKTNKGEYGPVEDAHLIINHLLAHWFQNLLKKN